MKIIHYFAYGSNMNTARVADRKLRTTNTQGGFIKGFRLAFNKCSRDHAGIGHANIERAEDSRVEGVLYELTDQEEILKMDPFEKAPWNYGRDVIPVVTHSGELIWAWTYFANSALKQEDLRPSADYLAHLLAGKRWLSSDYFEFLSQVESDAVIT